MSKRHDAIGIKQAIRYEWMQKTANLMLAGLDAKAIRQELHEYLADRMGSGERKERSVEARSFAVGILINTWVNCADELKPMRDDLLTYVTQGGGHELAAHWAMLSSAYPFWFNVARQTGRILALQEQVTMKQISSRTIEQYGDRQTVSRNVQFVVRSFSSWNVLVESESNGCYEKASPAAVSDTQLAVLMFESALHATPEPKAALGLLLNNPAFFPFKLPVMTGDRVLQCTNRIDVVRYGLDDELLKLKSA